MALIVDGDFYRFACIFDSNDDNNKTDDYFLWTFPSLHRFQPPFLLFVPNRLCLSIFDHRDPDNNDSARERNAEGKNDIESEDNPDSRGDVVDNRVEPPAPLPPFPPDFDPWHPAQIGNEPQRVAFPRPPFLPPPPRPVPLPFPEDNPPFGVGMGDLHPGGLNFVDPRFRYDYTAFL